jgi:glycosyltransferase involved in cell wall biosynthesis
VNTATREGLPTSFLEALAHRCAILSCVNPDGITEHFGCHVEYDDFTQGLSQLLEGDNWKEKGESGYHYVKENHELGKVIDQHISIYREVLNK